MQVSVLAFAAVLVAAVPTAAHASAFSFTRSLGIGERGDDVTELQNKLVAEGIYSGPVTGYFGPLTAEAVKLFQAKYGISQVGLVGPQTRQKLNEVEQEGINTGTEASASSTEATSTESTDLHATSTEAVSSEASSTEAVSAESPDKNATSTEATSSEDNNGAGGCSDGHKYNANTGALCPVNASGTGGDFGASVSAFARSLQLGARGEDVRQLQLLLINAGLLSATSTGYFGPLTEDALKRFQEQHGLGATGEMDSKTQSELDN